MWGDCPYSVHPDILTLLFLTREDKGGEIMTPLFQHSRTWVFITVTAIHTQSLICLGHGGLGRSRMWCPQNKALRGLF